MLKIYGLFNLSYFALLLVSAFNLLPFIQAPGYKGILLQENNIALAGTLLDKTTNLPVPHAHITVIGQKTYYESDSNGNFKLSIKPEFRNGKIKVSSLGYLFQEFGVADLLKQYTATKTIKLSLVPDYKNLQVVDVTAKAKKWRIKKAGYHIDEGASLHFNFFPSDTLTIAVPGHEIGTRITLDKYPASLRSISFGLEGLTHESLLFRVRLYSLKDNLPHHNQLPESAIIAIPPHHGGWITVNLQDYNIKLKEDFVIVVGWDDTKELNTSSLMAFANIPKGQVIFYRESNLKPWQVIKSNLLNVKSLGMYATVLYEK
jgi:hypothetical protein